MYHFKAAQGPKKRPPIAVSKFLERIFQDLNKKDNCIMFSIQQGDLVQVSIEKVKPTDPSKLTGMFIGASKDDDDRETIIILSDELYEIPSYQIRWDNILSKLEDL